MSFKNILNFFSPKDKTFFPLFEEATNKLTKMSDALHEGVNASKDDRESYFKKIDELSESIEKISHKMNIELSKNFITPFDREDIHSLMTTIEDVASNLQEASNRIRMYQVEKITKSIRKITEINLEACQLIMVSVKELKEMSNFKNIFESVKKINKLDRKSDSVFEKAIADIFENETDVKNIIKYKEVLASLDKASDKCKAVARVLEAVAVKHS
ncbi:MAG: DUF47 family protein [Candidatus Fonsibacter sp.]|jgi:uncharacterized protein Yka (UPF0111/DUF47 family)|uniref:DUF47 domain-containing protein n=1 Tax=Flavobacterium sp. TaxID=239 RepID=UPI001B45BA24|nr:DUF47 family protein [Flavobacterium sp.]MBP6127690.1 DUF47 family protein [Flavobacterium sp.]MBP7836984.1 DUF47 family protein [Candidatus Fonsibacter sp.]